MPFPIEGDCRPGHGGEPSPHALHFGLSSGAVKDIVDWHGREHDCFKRSGEDGATCMVCHDLPSGLRGVDFHDSGQEPAK